jgi:hypothetical protein
MGKRARKNRKQASEKKEKPRQIGRDFGCMPVSMALGSFDLPKLLHDAGVVGVAYGEAWAEELGETIPMISLIATSGRPLAAAFKLFKNWADATDPDSLELTIVLKKNGSYVVMLSPEATRLERRCLGYDRTSTTLITSTTWCKPIDSVSPHLLQMKEYLSGTMSPFFFNGVLASGPISTFSRPNITILPEIQPLLKFEATVINESSVIPGSMASVAVKSGKSPKAPSEFDPRSLDRIGSSRLTMLRDHFPVTLERLRNSEHFLSISRALLSEGFSAWQVEQAYCNRIFEADNTGAVDRSLTGTKESALKALQQRYELADEKPILAIGVNEIRAQIILDSIALLKHLHIKRSANESSEIVSLLRDAGVLDAPSVLTTEQLL